MTSNKVSFISPKLKHRSEKTVDFYSFFQVKKGEKNLPRTLSDNKFYCYEYQETRKLFCVTF